MQLLQNTSIRRKQVLIIMLTSGVALLLACAAFIAYDTVTFRRELSERVTVLADAIGNNCAAAIDFNDSKAAEETLAGLRADGNIVSACVYSRDGRVFAVYQRDTGSSFVPPAMESARQEFTGDELHLFRPIKQGGVLTGVIFVASDLKNLSSRLMSYVAIVGLVFLTSLLVVLLLSSRLQRLVSDPILHLAQVARAVAEDRNYSLRAKKQSTDEIGQLVDGFNEMLAQIQQRDAALQSARAGLEIRVAERTAELAKTNEALQRQQAELRVLFDLMPAMIWFKDTENGILRVNKQASEIAGKSIEEIEGKPSLEIYPQEAARFYADDLEVIRSGEPKLGIIETLRDRDGKELWVQTDKVPYCDKDGKVIGIVVMAQDITERKRLEAQLVQSQKMETVGKLAGGIAHEFNSILTAIIGQSELLLRDLPAGSSLAYNATEISKAAGRAATLTRQLLAYGRKQILQPETLNLNRVLAGMEGMLRPLMGGDVDVRIVPAIDLQAVKADAGQIEQVIMNIAINAREAMPQGGKLTLETSNVAFDPEGVVPYPELKKGNYAMLAITDTGLGMSEEVRKRLFEPFFTTKEVGQGTGLGLATCYGIVKQSGGHIGAYSELGKGTVIKVYLPQAETEAKAAPHPYGSPDLPCGTETILLVEDDPALREMSAGLLRRLGYSVLAAANGVEALNLTHQPGTGHIDLLFTDVVMPQMSGKELSDRIQSSYPGTKVVFASAYTENAIVHQGVLDDGVVLLQKPFTPSALALKLREVLDGRS